MNVESDGGLAEPGAELARLRRVAGPRANAVADAVEAALAEVATVDERAWIERIEAHRARLDASTEQLSYVDYGAGAPDLALSAEQMRVGRPVTRTLGELCRGSSKPRGEALLLFHLVRRLRPRRCLELGTCLGISAAYQAAALRLNAAGRLVSLEGGEAVAGKAEEGLRALGLDNARVVRGPFATTLAGVLAADGPFDFVFLDGHHDEGATLDYFHALQPRLAADALLVLDDIAWSAGMRRAWDVVRAAPRVACSLVFANLGLCLLDASPAPR
jgi:predicted O-methyltransferase YrrM